MQIESQFEEHQGTQEVWEQVIPISKTQHCYWKVAK